MTPSQIFAPRGGKTEIEEGSEFSPKFDADGLIPAMAVLFHRYTYSLNMAWTPPPWSR